MTHPLQSPGVPANGGPMRRRPDGLSRIPAGWLVLGSIACGQVGSAFAVTMFHRVGPGGAVLLRLVWATALLLAMTRPTLREQTRRDAWSIAAFGVSLAGMNLAFYFAIDHIDIGPAVTIEFIGPLAVAVAGSRRLLDVIWAAVAAIGILALTQGASHRLDTLGVAYALLAGAFWAAYIMLNTRIGRSFEGGSGLSLAMCVACVCSAPVGVLDGGSRLLAPSSLALGVVVGVLSSAIPYAFEVEALRRIAVPVFSVLMCLEPAFAALAGLILLGQGLDALSIFGIALVVGASMGASRRAPL